MTTAIFLFASYCVLMSLILHKGQFDIIAPYLGLDNIHEKIFIGFICNLLFLMVFDMFYWRSCRKKCPAVCRCTATIDKHQQTWAELRGHTFSEENCGRNQQSSIIASYDVGVDNQYYRL